MGAYEYDQERLEFLRDKASKELEAKKKRQQDIDARKKDFNALRPGDAIAYRPGFVGKMKGEVLNRYEKKSQVSFDIKCGKDTYFDIHFNENSNIITRRVTSKERYKDVVVRQNFKDMSTDNLIAKLKVDDPTHINDREWWYDEKPNEKKNHQVIKELRAELSRRPNIPNKKQKKESS